MSTRCLAPACPNERVGAYRYCDEHRSFRPARPTRRRSIYNTAHWRRTRTRILARDPICVLCWHAASDTVDHMDADGPDYPPDDRLRGVCSKCHSKRHAHERTPTTREAPTPPAQSSWNDAAL